MMSITMSYEGLITARLRPVKVLWMADGDKQGIEKEQIKVRQKVMSMVVANYCFLSCLFTRVATKEQEALVDCSISLTVVMKPASLPSPISSSPSSSLILPSTVDGLVDNFFDLC
ncbi:uncharacterized protein BX664DRAFT_315648 [Halteromyces radiatus]|uniref:uncharacterized protein n=1 Tax=Halteromyces radiatus TaxID=101107 RepID=UPI00221F3123|nr:uncharacterized protein BX664DRAFT_315648 [Halteromyces radiatus]KAI8086458.1 hypothetical protein BX664DRAFT_315648 [Halteromyces radiatus]